MATIKEILDKLPDCLKEIEINDYNANELNFLLNQVRCVYEIAAPKPKPVRQKLIYNVHIGMRYTADQYVYACSPEEAQDIAEERLDEIDINDCDFASSDFSAWLADPNEIDDCRKHPEFVWGLEEGEKIL